MSPYVRYKPRSNEKVERNRGLYQYHLEHPRVQQKDLGPKFGISPGAVCRIIQRMKKASTGNELAVKPIGGYN